MRSSPSLAAFAAAFLSLPAFAGNGAPDPGSLLLFPIFEHGTGHFTAITVTNTSSDFTPAGSLFAGTVDVEFIYVRGDPVGTFYCGEFNRTRRLTPNDTITVASNLDNTSFNRGYLYVFAKSPFSGAAIKFDHLIGNAFQIAQDNAYEVNPFVFRAGRSMAPGAPTDDGDGIRELNGSEYEPVQDRILVPHFFGESTDPNRSSWLVLINLSGASQFQAIANFLIYNDNEQVFSSAYSFRCWTKVRLSTITGAFNESFLDDTDDASGESILGSESGWYRINGGGASSSADSVTDPALLAVQISAWGFPSGAPAVGSELPYMTGGANPTTGELISLSPFHD